MIDLPKKPTLIEDLPSEDYYGIGLDRAVSYSSVSSFASEPTPLHYFKKEICKDAPKGPFSMPFYLGGLFHQLCEDASKEAFFERYFILPKTVKKGSSRYLELIAENNGKKPVREADIRPILSMFDALESTEVFKLIREKGKNEVSIFWEHNGYKIKGRADVWIPEADLIIDFKTTKNENPFIEEGFQSSIKQWKYHWQAAFYCWGAQLVTGRRHRFAIIACSKEFPHLPCFYEITADQIEQGKREMIPYLNKLIECLQTGDWGDGYGSRFHTPASIGNQYSLEDDISTLIGKV